MANGAEQGSKSTASSMGATIQSITEPIDALGYAVYEALEQPEFDGFLHLSPEQQQSLVKTNPTILTFRLLQEIAGRHTQIENALSELFTLEAGEQLSPEQIAGLMPTQEKPLSLQQQVIKEMTQILPPILEAEEPDNTPAGRLQNSINQTFQALVAQVLAYQGLNNGAGETSTVLSEPPQSPVQLDIPIVIFKEERPAVIQSLDWEQLDDPSEDSTSRPILIAQAMRKVIDEHPAFTSFLPQPGKKRDILGALAHLANLNDQEFAQLVGLFNSKSRLRLARLLQIRAYMFTGTMRPLEEFHGHAIALIRENKKFPKTVTKRKAPAAPNTPRAAPETVASSNPLEYEYPRKFPQPPTETEQAVSYELARLRNNTEKDVKKALETGEFTFAVIKQFLPDNVNTTNFNKVAFRYGLTPIGQTKDREHQNIYSLRTTVAILTLFHYWDGHGNVKPLRNVNDTKRLIGTLKSFVGLQLAREGESTITPSRL